MNDANSAHQLTANELTGEFELITTVSLTFTQEPQP